MRLASIDQKDKKDEMLTPTQIQQQQMMQQEKGIGGQFMDMAKQKAMSSVIDKGLTTAMGTGAGSAAMAGMPYVGAGLMGAKLLGLFEHGGLVGPLSPQYNAEGKGAMATPQMKDLFRSLVLDELAKEQDEIFDYHMYGRHGPDVRFLGKSKYKKQGGEIPMPMMRPVPMPMMKPDNETLFKQMGEEYLRQNPQDAAMSLEGYEPILDGSYINASPVMSEIDKMRADYLKSLGE